MDKLAIVGAGGHGKVVAEAAISMERFSEIVFIDARNPDLSSQLGIPVAGNDSAISHLISAGFQFVVAIGNNDIRKKKYEALKAQSAKLATVVHACAVVSPSARVGEGTVVFAKAVINADATIEKNVIINTGAIVEHDCYVGPHAHVAPGSVLAGGSALGATVLFGMGASLLPGIKIAENVIVAAGAVVISNIEASVVIAGVPAKVISST